MKQEELFKMFCSGDDLRPVLQLPFESNGKVVATDSYRLIRCDKDLVDFEIVNGGKAPNVDSVFPELNCNRIVTTKIEDFDFLKTEDEYKKVGKDIPCKECGGKGKVVWEYKNFEIDLYCPVCKGDGLSVRSKSIKTGNKTFPDYDCYVKIDECYFSPKIIYSLFEFQKIVGGDIISLNLVNGKRPKPAAFRIGIYELLFMPLTEGNGNILEITFKK